MRPKGRREKTIGVLKGFADSQIGKIDQRSLKSYRVRHRHADFVSSVDGDGGGGVSRDRAGFIVQFGLERSRRGRLNCLVKRIRWEIRVQREKEQASKLSGSAAPVDAGVGEESNANATAGAGAGAEALGKCGVRREGHSVHEIRDKRKNPPRFQLP